MSAPLWSLPRDQQRAERARRQVVRAEPSAILALDIGSTMGWAYSGAGRIQHGTIKLPTGDHPGSRMAALHSWLTEVKATFGGFDFIVWEDAFRQPGKANAIHHRLVGAMLRWAYHHQIGVMPVGVTAIKRWAAGSGTAGKPEMIAAARAAGFEPEDDNAADALNLLRYVLTESVIEQGRAA